MSRNWMSVRSVEGTVTGALHDCMQKVGVEFQVEPRGRIEEQVWDV